MSNIRVLIGGVEVSPTPDFYASISQAVRDVINRQPAQMPISLSMSLSRGVAAHQRVSGMAESTNRDIGSVDAVAPYIRHSAVVEVNGRDLYSGAGEAILKNTSKTAYEWELFDGQNSVVSRALKTKVWEVGANTPLEFSAGGINGQIGSTDVDYLLHAFAADLYTGAGGFGYVQQLRPCQYATDLFTRIATYLGCQVVQPVDGSDGFGSLSRHAFQVGRSFKHCPANTTRQVYSLSTTNTNTFPTTTSPNWNISDFIADSLLWQNQQTQLSGDITGKIRLKITSASSMPPSITLNVSADLIDTGTGAIYNVLSPYSMLFGTSLPISYEIPIAFSYSDYYFVSVPLLRVTVGIAPVSGTYTNIAVEMRREIRHTFAPAEDIATNAVASGSAAPNYSQQDVLYSLFGDMTIAEFVAQWADFFSGEAAYLNNRIYAIEGRSLLIENCGAIDLSRYTSLPFNVVNGIGENQTYIVKRDTPEMPLFQESVTNFVVPNSGNKASPESKDITTVYFTYTDDSGFLQYDIAAIFTYVTGKTVNDIISGSPQCYYVYATDIAGAPFDLPMSDNVGGGTPYISFARRALASPINQAVQARLDLFSQMYFYYGLTADFDASIPSDTFAQLLYGEQRNRVPAIFAPVLTQQGYFRIKELNNAVPKERGNFTFTAYADRLTNA